MAQALTKVLTKEGMEVEEEGSVTKRNRVI
jgi:hypothetical protein